MKIATYFVPCKMWGKKGNIISYEPVFQFLLKTSRQVAVTLMILLVCLPTQLNWAPK